MLGWLARFPDGMPVGTSVVLLDQQGKVRVDGIVYLKADTSSGDLVTVGLGELPLLAEHGDPFSRSVRFGNGYHARVFLSESADLIFVDAAHRNPFWRLARARLPRLPFAMATAKLVSGWRRRVYSINAGVLDKGIIGRVRGTYTGGWLGRFGKGSGIIKG